MHPRKLINIYQNTYIVLLSIKKFCTLSKILFCTFFFGGGGQKLPIALSSREGRGGGRGGVEDTSACFTEFTVGKEFMVGKKFMVQ